MLRAASIGLGWWSNELAAAIQGKSSRIGIASCYSRSAGKRETFAASFRTGRHESFEAVFADPAIDAVILTTPHSMHAEHVIDLASGATAYLGTMCAAPFSGTCNVYGTAASAFVHVDTDELRVQPVGGRLAVRPLEHVDTLLADLEEFAEACAGRATFRVTPEEAIHTVAVMEAITASGGEGGRAMQIGD